MKMGRFFVKTVSELELVADYNFEEHRKQDV